jgi:hypothetical protein
MTDPIYGQTGIAIKVNSPTSTVTDDGTNLEYSLIGAGSAAGGWWWLYSGRVDQFYRVVPNTWFVRGELVIPVANNRYVRRSISAVLTGNCTASTLSSSVTTNRLKAALAGASASLRYG